MFGGGHEGYPLSLGRWDSTALGAAGVFILLDVVGAEGAN